MCIIVYAAPLPQWYALRTCPNTSDWFATQRCQLCNSGVSGSANACMPAVCVITILCVSVSVLALLCYACSSATQVLVAVKCLQHACVLQCLLRPCSSQQCNSDPVALNACMPAVCMHAVCVITMCHHDTLCCSVCYGPAAPSSATQALDSQQCNPGTGGSAQCLHACCLIHTALVFVCITAQHSRVQRRCEWSNPQPACLLCSKVHQYHTCLYIVWV